MTATAGPEGLPDAARAAWGWRDATVAPVPGGLINRTYEVRVDDAPVAVVQRLHPVFAPEVNLDLEAVTEHLASHGMVTPRLVRTVDGHPWLELDGAVWRALTWVDGETVHRVPDPSWAEAGGELVGRFHRAVAELRHDYAFARAGVHDTEAHLARLAEHLAGAGPTPEVDLGRQILALAADLPFLPATPRRHCHGDLKISNLRFARAPVRATSLVDLDTLGLGTMAFELGDAMRSWCNPHGEDAADITFDLPVFAAAMRGVRRVAGDLLTRDEWTSVVSGLETVCVELAARFCVDVFRDAYFGWDSARFASRRDHNLARARGQLALGRAVRAARGDALDVVHG